ncbi:MAG TPA: peptide-methionine (S)-S-oxide reductase MsrA [Gemmatimonadales bacterium]|nr:peptide-methionine (S)-S-oxide reductase MsrA [Gemmatimonadales bacterium]
MKHETTTLGGGCFWCLETVLDRITGVVSVDSGYSGGTVPSPSYEQVCSGTTGHAEVVRVTFDPSELPFSELLELFFAFHDPTTLNRQGVDVGEQYRSVIFAENDEQYRIAGETIARLEAEGVHDAPIVTRLERLDRFWPAEDYHRQYYVQHPEQAYCRSSIAPKVAKLRAGWAGRLKEGS